MCYLNLQGHFDEGIKCYQWQHFTYYSRKLLISGEITHVLHEKLHMYYIRFKTSLLIQLITCFYYSHSIRNPFLSLLIDDVTQLYLLRLAKN